MLWNYTFLYLIIPYIAILKNGEIEKKFLGYGKNPALFSYKGNLYTIWAYNDTTGFEEIRFSKYDTSWAETKSSYTTLNTHYWGIGSPSFYIENDTGYVVFESAKGYTYHILPIYFRFNFKNRF